MEKQTLDLDKLKSAMAHFRPPTDLDEWSKAIWSLRAAECPEELAWKWSKQQRKYGKFCFYLTWRDKINYESTAPDEFLKQAEAAGWKYQPSPLANDEAKEDEL